MAGEIRCVGCGATYAADAKFCGQCGLESSVSIAANTPSGRPAAATVLASPPSLGAPEPPKNVPSSRPRAAAKIFDAPSPPVFVAAPASPRAGPAASSSSATEDPGVGLDVPLDRLAGFVDRVRRSSRETRMKFGLGVLLALAFVAFIQRVFSTSVEATPDFTQGEPTLALDISHVDDGTTVDVLGQSLRVRDGRAVASLRDDALVPGPNPIRAVVDGEAFDLSIEVPFVVLLDDAALDHDPPRVGIVVRASPGDAIRIDGKSVALDPNATARTSEEVPMDGTAFEHAYRVSHEHEGTTTERTFRIHVTPATLEVVQPPREFVTDRASIELEGRIAQSAVARLDGVSAAVGGGRLHANLSLPREGDFSFRLDVTEPGKRRRREVFLIRRVADLESAARQFLADATIDYPALARGGEAILGRPVSYVGRVVQLRVEHGRSFVNVAVSPCDRTDACPLRIEYPAATTLRIDSRITVRGHVLAPAPGAAAPTPRVEAVFLTEARE